MNWPWRLSAGSTIVARVNGWPSERRVLYEVLNDDHTARFIRVLDAKEVESGA